MKVMITLKSIQSATIRDDQLVIEYDENNAIGFRWSNVEFFTAQNEETITE